MGSLRREVAHLAADILGAKARAGAETTTGVPVANKPAPPGAPATPVTSPVLGRPLTPGALAPAISVTAEQLQQLVVAALGTQSLAVDQPALSQVVWYDHDGEVLCDLGRTLVRLLPGVVLVALTMETDETGAGQVVVPLGVGTPSQPAGLLVATEARPRGPVALVDRWGEAAVAAAWDALLQSAHALALHSGTDTFGARLVPGAISTDGKTFAVVPQARHAIDAVVGR